MRATLVEVYNYDNHMVTTNRTLLVLTMLSACGPKAPTKTTTTFETSSTTFETSSTTSMTGSSGPEGSTTDTVVGTTTGTPDDSTGASTGSSSASTEAVDTTTSATTGVTTTDTGFSSTDTNTGGLTSSSSDESSNSGTTEESPTTGGEVEKCDYIIPCNADSECATGRLCKKLPTEGSVCVAPCVGSDAATNCLAASNACSPPAPLKCQHSADAGLFCFPVS